ncbi:MAG: hypothetical protein R2764_23770 [Bacteroidales bacterium]
MLRNPKVHQIVKDDWETAIQLFKEYVEYQSLWAIMLGKPDQIWNKYTSDGEIIEKIDRTTNRATYGYYGFLFDRIPFGAVHSSSGTYFNRGSKRTMVRGNSKNEH